MNENVNKNKKFRP